MKTAERQLEGFIAKFAPPVAKLIRAARKKLRRRLPGAHELVYDNWNFMVIAYAPTDRASDAIFSLAAYAKGLNFFFAHGVKLPDPQRLLQGAGKQVRSIRLESAATLDEPAVEALIAVALERAKVPLDGHSRHTLTIKSVSAKQRPRR